MTIVSRHESILPTLSDADRDAIRRAAAGSIDGCEARLDGVQALRLSDAWSYREEALDALRSEERYGRGASDDETWIAAYRAAYHDILTAADED